MKSMLSRAWSARVAAAFGVATVVSVQALAPAQAAAVDGGWTRTHTLSFPVAGALKLGELPAATPLHIVVGLKLNNREDLDSFLARQMTPGNPLFGARLTSEQFVSRYSPTNAQVRAVTDYLNAYGFTNIKVAANRLIVEADTTAASVSSAFNTQLSQFRLNDRTVFANTRDVHVPAPLSNIVLSVLGLQTFEKAHTMIEKAEASTQVGPAKGFLPTEFPKVYNAVGYPDGSGTDVAIISAGSMTQTLKDLRQFESENGLMQVPVNLVPVGPLSSDSSGTPEWDLDSQNITGMAGNTSTSKGVSSLTFYTATSLADSALTPTYNKAVIDNFAKVINVSLGECELVAYTSGAMATDDQIYAQASAQGQTFMVSSGDSGSQQCSAIRGPTVSYPASSPYVMTLGGTSLYADSYDNYVSESTWSGTGGGISQVEAAPSWQQSYLGATKRLVPDFAMDADPNTGSKIVVNGNHAQYGGTSLSAPLATGVWARFESWVNNGIGFAPPVLYYIAKYIPTPMTPFHDVKTGSNGAYTAATGFDYTTGYGSFDVGAIFTDEGYTP